MAEAIMPVKVDAMEGGTFKWLRLLVMKPTEGAMPLQRSKPTLPAA